MPLVYQQNINANAKIGVWHITEPATFFEEKITIQNEVRHPQKIMQHLAGRYLLQSLHPGFPAASIKINAAGKPFLDKGNLRFSISHSGDYAAVIMAENSDTGIDIEKPNEKIERIKEKFTTAEELGLFSSTHFSTSEKLTIIWSIKEAMFKWYGLGMIDFKKHLQIVGIEIRENEVMADCHFKKKQIIEIKSVSKLINEYVLTYVI